MEFQTDVKFEFELKFESRKHVIYRLRHQQMDVHSEINQVCIVSGIRGHKLTQYWFFDIFPENAFENLDY